MGSAWQKTYKAAKEYKEIVGRDALAQDEIWRNVPITYPVKLTVWVCLSGNRVADTVDALTWLKVAFDQLVAIGVWPDDSDAYLNPVTVGIERVTKRPRVELYWHDASGKV